MMRCLIMSDGYDVIQKICAEMPPAQKLMAGVDKLERSLSIRVKIS